MRIRSLRVRTVVQLLALLALTLVAFCWAMHMVIDERVEAEVDQLVVDKAIILARIMNPANPAWMNHDPRDWESRRYRIIGQTFDLDWNVLYRSPKLNSPVEPTARVRREIHHTQGIVLEDAVAQDGERFRVATVAARPNVNQPAFAYAQMLVPLRDRDREIWRFMRWMIGGCLVVLAGGSLGAMHLAGQWFAPLHVMGHTAESVDPRNLSRQRIMAPPDVPEVTPLVTAFNSLLDRLESVQTAQQRFVADASHELRTPLTIVRGEIEVALRRDRSVEEYRQTLESCREEIEGLGELVDGLLVLARCDAGVASSARPTGDLGYAVRDVCQKLAERAEARGVRLIVDAASAAVVPLDEVSLSRVVLNLTDNAIRHSPPGESVAVSVRCTEKEAVLRVSDHGIGIAPEHHVRIFDRFYRIDAGRSREGGGTGLGLAIVKAMVEASGGKVAVTSDVGKGSEFEVRWNLPS